MSQMYPYDDAFYDYHDAKAAHEQAKADRDDDLSYQEMRAAIEAGDE